MFDVFCYKSDIALAIVNSVVSSISAVECQSLDGVDLRHWPPRDHARHSASVLRNYLSRPSMSSLVFLGSSGASRTNAVCPTVVCSFRHMTSTIPFGSLISYFGFYSDPLSCFTISLRHTKPASRERANAPRGFAARQPVLARLVSLAQIGELARRLFYDLAKLCFARFFHRLSAQFEFQRLLFRKIPGLRPVGDCWQDALIVNLALKNYRNVFVFEYRNRSTERLSSREWYDVWSLVPSRRNPWRCIDRVR